MCRTRTRPCETRSLTVLDQPVTQTAEQSQAAVTRAASPVKWTAVVKATSSHLLQQLQQQQQQQQQQPQPQPPSQQQQQQQVDLRSTRMSRTARMSRVNPPKMTALVKSAQYGKRLDLSRSPLYHSEGSMQYAPLECTTKRPTTLSISAVSRDTY